MESKAVWLERAKGIVGEKNLLVRAEDIEPYSHDEFALDSYARPPLAVVKPASEQDLAEIVRLCSEMRVPVTPRGGGTGLSAGCVPAPNGIVLSLERLNRIIDADRENLTITVQAGLPLKKLYEAVEEMNLYFPPHPGDEGAFIGGAVATNAGGARAVKYGTVKRFVLGLQAVLADGRIIEIGGKFIKSSTGYGLIDLMIGSEGTLAVITRITVSLLPMPASIQTIVVPFAGIDEAVKAAASILHNGIIPTAVEFVEHSVIRSAERLLKQSWPAQDGQASLMIILDGVTEDEVLNQAEKLAGVMEQNQALDVLIAENKERQAAILELRSMLYEALRPGTVELFDICVPRSGIVGHLQFIRELEKKYGLNLPTYGHAADGNIHTHFMRRKLVDGEIKDKIPGWEELHRVIRDELYLDAERRNGIISGEHGIGLVKKAYLEKNIGKDTVDVMRSIKKALDPHNILNPGKIFSV